MRGDDLGNTPLHSACACPYRDAALPALVRSFLAAGANPRAQNHCGQTPLHFAHHATAAHEIIKAGADPNARDDQGQDTSGYATISRWRGTGADRCQRHEARGLGGSPRAMRLADTIERSELDMGSRGNAGLHRLNANKWSTP